MMRLILLLSFLTSGCAHYAVGVHETCLPVVGQNLFECHTIIADRKLTAEQMKGFGCFPLEDIKDVFRPVQK